jgi:uncharacterized membrane protein
MTESENAPVPRYAARTVDAGRGVEWLKQGWDLFLKNPGGWIAIAVIALVIFVVLGLMPLVGQLAANLLAPVLGAGMLLGCRALVQGEELKVEHLFAGFRRNTGNLVLLGVIALVGGLLIGFVSFAIVGGGALSGAVIGQGTGVGVAAGGFLLGMLVFLALTVPLAMALWFAPALVVFRDAAPVDAVKASFEACLKNVVPFLVYGLLLFVLGVLAALPLGLGFVLLLPVAAGSVHAAYRDIFEAP